MISPQDQPSDQGEPRLGLTLSGGGFRATLFHLGVVRYLYQAGLLSSVRRIGAVSGGSILAAHLVLNWERYTGDAAAFDSAAREIIAFVKSDVRGRVVRRWFLAWLTVIPRLLRPRHWTFTNLLQRSYDRLYKYASLGDLHPKANGDRPQVFFNCTSLTTGSVCSFGRSGFMWYEEGVEHSIVAPATPVAFAVAASSAFPPLFPPIAVSNEVLYCDVKDFPNPQYLTDGGVYDNLGIDRLIWYHKQANDLDLFIVSDAEGNFDWEFGKEYTFITTRNVRASEVLMKRVSTLEYEALDTFGNLLIVLDIDTELQRPGDPAVLPLEVQRSLRNIRTDLDEFSSMEASCLIRHGFAVAQERLNQRGLGSNTISLSWEPLPPRGVVAPKANQIRKSRGRRLRLWSSRDWTSWAGLFLIVSIIAVFALPPYLNIRLAKAAVVEAKAARSRADDLKAVNERLTTVAVEYYREFHRPVEPGTSASHLESTAGTICCVVRLKSGGPQRYLLGADSFAPLGSKPGDLILQPGSIDGGSAPTDAVASLFRVVPLNPKGSNRAVGAIAQVLPNVKITNAITGLGPIRGIGEALSLGQEVYIAGRTTGIAKAVVSTLDMTAQIEYPELDSPIVFDGLIGLTAQISKEGATRGGDSGAPVLSTDGMLVGMIFAGSEGISLAVPIRPVLDALGAELDVESSTQSP